MTEPVPNTVSKPQDETKRREPVFNLPRVVIAFIALCVGVYFAQAYLLDDDQNWWLLIHAAFIPIRYSGEFTLDFYAFTSPVTYSLLHGSMAHLAVNMIWLAAFGSPLANRIGALRFVLFWIATSVAAVGLHYVLHMTDHSPLVGASGAISGMMGAAARFGFRTDHTASGTAFDGPILPMSGVIKSRGVLTFLVVWMVVNLVTGLIGLTPGVEDRIAWEAHIGGFLVGFLAIRQFDRPQPLQDNVPVTDRNDTV